MPTKEQYLNYLNKPEVKAFLDTIAWAEGGKSYYTLYGGGSFTGKQHPNKAITAGGYTSTAAGRYQFLYRTWIEIKNRLGLSDFSSINQDIAAIDLINQRGQLQKIASGDLVGTLKGLGCAWAALPYATCKQKQKNLQETVSYYNGALKVYSGNSNNPVITSNDIPAVIANTISSVKPEIKKDDNTIWYVLGAVAFVLLA